MKLTSIEGNTQRLDGGAMFGNAPKAVWQEWEAPDSENRIPLACRCLLLETDDGRVVLFEAGIGAFFEPKLKARFGVQENEHLLLLNLKKAGYDHKDISHVILSHLHFDHAGGLLSKFEEGKPPELLFPNARYVVGAQHWARALNPHPRDRASFLPQLNQLLLQSGRLDLITEGEQPFDSLILFRFSHGHTPGLLISEIRTPIGPLVFSSDLVPGGAWVHVPLSMGYDRFPEMIIDEKSLLLSDLYERQGSLFFTHDSKVACAKVERTEQGRYSTKEVDLNIFCGG